MRVLKMLSIAVLASTVSLSASAVVALTQPTAVQSNTYGANNQLVEQPVKSGQSSVDDGVNAKHNNVNGQHEGRSGHMMKDQNNMSQSHPVGKVIKPTESKVITGTNPGATPVITGTNPSATPQEGQVIKPAESKVMTGSKGMNENIPGSGPEGE